MGPHPDVYDGEQNQVTLRVSIFFSTTLHAVRQRIAWEGLRSVSCVLAENKILGVEKKLLRDKSQFV